MSCGNPPSSDGPQFQSNEIKDLLQVDSATCFAKALFSGDKDISECAHINTGKINSEFIQPIVEYTDNAYKYYKCAATQDINNLMKEYLNEDKVDNILNILKNNNTIKTTILIICILIVSLFILTIINTIIIIRN